MVKFIYFDFGAVLVNYDEMFKKVCADFNLSRDNFRDFYSNFVLDMDIGKESVSEFWKKSIEKFGLQNAWDYNFPKSWVSDYKIIKPVFEMIHSLEGRVDVGIISNIHADIWWAALADNWVPKVKYKQILLSSDLGVIKPDKHIYEIAQEKSKVKSEEILFVDDKEENLVEPRKMGWKTILFDQNSAIDGVNKIMELLG